MRTPLSTGGDLGRFIVAEFEQRAIKILDTHDLPELLASWRVHETTEPNGGPKILALTVRASNFREVADFCSALFASARRRPSHVISSQQSATGATLMVEGTARPAAESDREFTFNVPGGVGQFSRSGSSVVILVHRTNTMSFIAKEDERGVYIAFIDHNAAEL